VGSQRVRLLTEGEGGGASPAVKAWPIAGKTLEGPLAVYIAKLTANETRKLAADPDKSEQITVKVESNGKNATVEANVGQTIEGKTTLEIGSGAGAENNSETLVYDGEGTWWRL
jgi:hypothetical protein